MYYSLFKFFLLVWRRASGVGSLLKGSLNLGLLLAGSLGVLVSCSSSSSSSSSKVLFWLQDGSGLRRELEGAGCWLGLSSSGTIDLSFGSSGSWTTYDSWSKSSNCGCELFFELSLNTPVCGIFQIAGNEEAIEVVQLVASGVDIRQCQYQIELKLLQDVVPIVASFLLKLPYDVEIPSDICSLITEMCNLALAPFSRPSSSFPPPTPENKLSFFPNLPKIHGTNCYSADQHSKGLV